MDVGNSLLAAPAQNELREHLRDHFRNVVRFLFEMIYSAGYAPGTEPPQGTDSQLAAGVAKMRELLARPQGWTPREDKFAREWLEAAWRRRNGSGH